MAIGAVLGGAALGGAATAIMQPALEPVIQIANAQVKARIPQIFELPLLLRRQQISEEQYYDYCERNGYDRDVADQLRVLTETYLSPVDYAVLWRRGVINEKDFSELLTKSGFETYSAEHLKLLTKWLPGPQDLITQAVREVFTPDIRSKFEMDSDYPAEFEKRAALVGIESAEAKDLWAAHWELISVNQGFEMLQRRDGSIDKGIISQDELNQLLRAKDVMPFWRDKLTKISFAPYTRVDVRRMYSIGELSEEEVTMAYMDIGYDREHADKLTHFTVREYSMELAGITKSKVISAYKQGIIDLASVTKMLETLNISPKAIEFELSIADFEIREDELKFLELQLSAMYQSGAMTIEEVRNQLSSANAPSQFTETVITKLLRTSAVRRKMPSRTDLERWFEKDIIDENRYFRWMMQIGYSSEFSQLYMSEIVLDNQSKKRTFMGPAVYKRWAKNGIMSEIEYRQVLTDMGKSERDIKNAVSEVLGNG